jgi:phenylpropionate dioxygenase-like ring-hydroxylating dioxygenase large terminal subunit
MLPILPRPDRLTHTWRVEREEWGEWARIGAADEVTTRPRTVLVDGVPLVVLRMHDAGPPVAFPDHCPHRLVPLSAATLDQGVLRCAYHGWEFAADGTCVAVPSLGDKASIPPRASLTGLPVKEEGDAIWVRRPDAGPAGGDPVELASNVDPELRRAWHPVALSTELPLEATLLGVSYSVQRVGDGVEVSPTPHAVQERWGLVWIAPEPPLVDLFDDPDAEDRDFVGAWLPPSVTNASAAFVADNFLDVAHFPFVHAGTFGAGEETSVPPYEIADEPYGVRSIQDQWFDNPEDPGVVEGRRPVRQRRRATYVYRVPFQLLLRLEELDAGAVKTILFFAQPQTLTSTRVYTKMLLHGIGGVDRPGPDVVANEVAFEQAVLAEDLALHAKTRLTGLPLTPRDELHVRADRLGVALRRQLRTFRTDYLDGLAAR